MPERRTIDDRLSALERRLEDAPGADAETPATATANAGPADAAPETDLEARIETLEAEIADLEAGLQAVRGYVGSVERVNESVERRANAAIAAVERLESAPKTPPPIATATGHSAPAGSGTESAAESAEPDEWADSTPEADGDDGVLARLRALR